tara:strand:- start:637 stop:1020 length:384 start_codon:yes stop_codon:yes gene_type:complete
MGIGSEHKYNVHSVVRSNINSLERQVNQLKKELSAMKSSVANMKADIQNLKRNNQMLKNTITNSPTIDSVREAVTVEPIPARDLVHEDWMESAPIRNSESGIQWVKKKGTEDWYYLDHTGDWKLLLQ